VTAADPGTAEPLFTITAGNPTPEELAAVTALLLAVARASSAPGQQPAPQVGGWADPARRLRRPLSPGPGAWRASAWW
jgi:hypothetical protein